MPVDPTNSLALLLGAVAALASAVGLVYRSLLAETQRSKTAVEGDRDWHRRQNEQRADAQLTALTAIADRLRANEDRLERTDERLERMEHALGELIRRER